MWQIQNRVVEGVEIRVLSALRSPFLDSRRAFSFASSPPFPPASTAPGEVLHAGLLEGSCGLRRRRDMRNRLNAGTYAPASEYETLTYLKAVLKNNTIAHTTTDKSVVLRVDIIVANKGQPGSIYEIK